MRDVEFHRQVVAGTGNVTLCSIVDGISARALRARVWRASMAGVKTMTLEQHALILEALERRDPALARSAATVHVSASERWLREFLESNPRGHRAPPKTPPQQEARAHDLRGLAEHR
jgi:GntR family transcriptional repressor for pyruvate dehydrogenase complex